MAWYLTVAKWVAITVGAYLLSVVVQYLLDSYLRYVRLDKKLLFSLFVKRPHVRTKVVFQTTGRPNLLEFKKTVEAQCQLYRNEKLRGSSWIFAIEGGKNPLKISFNEPTKNNIYHLSLETVGSDKYGFFSNELSATVENMELISKLLGTRVGVISTNVEISYRIPPISSPLKTHNITVNHNRFTTVKAGVREAINNWILENV